MLETRTDGSWSSPGTWTRPDGTEGVPGPDDVVRINPDHTVVCDVSDTVQVSELHNHGTLMSASGKDLKLEAASLIYNEGRIWGADGADGSGTPSNYAHARPGSSVILESPTVYNGENGNIQAGRGGNDETYLSFTGYYNWPDHIHARGGHGGAILVSGESITNEGIVGPNPDCVPEDFDSHYDTWPVPDQDADGGSGGKGSNWNGWIEAGSEHDHLYNSGNATGGDAGDTVLIAVSTLTNTHTGRISGGNGGFARVWSDIYNHTPGTGGKVVFSAPNTVNDGEIFGGCTGAIMWEPGMMMAGSTARIHGVKDISIFGGDNWTLDLTNLPDGAISATDTITLALGEGGVVDLRGTDAGAFQAGSQVSIFADTILTDDETSLSDIIDAPDIVTGPAKILYDVILIAPLQISGEPGETVSADFYVINNSPADDSYTLQFTDAEDWNLNALSSVDIGSLGHKKLSLDITLPSEPDAENMPAITAASSASPDTMAKAELSVMTNTSPGDIDGNRTVDLGDAVSAMKVLAGMKPEGVRSVADVNGDGRIGIEEVVYILRRLSQSR